MALYGAANDPVDVSDLTENGGAIGGTNDGDLPDMSSVSSPPTQAEVQAIRDGVRENAAQLNKLRASLSRTG